MTRPDDQKQDSFELSDEELKKIVAEADTGGRRPPASPPACCC